MSNRFVSGGTINASRQAPPEEPGAQTGQRPHGSHNAEWEAVQKELEAERKRREEERVKAAHGQETSLYEVLQANKAAKEAAFQEANKLRNQFRALDDDEIDFLDEVVSKQKQVENERKRELEEGVKAFREAQKGSISSKLQVGFREDDGQDNGGPDPGEPGESWGVGRKRKRREKDALGIVRKKAEPVKAKEPAEHEKERDEKKVDEEDSAVLKPLKEEEQKNSEPAIAEKKGILGLVDYGSDSDED